MTDTRQPSLFDPTGVQDRCPHGVCSHANKYHGPTTGRCHYPDCPCVGPIPTRSEAITEGHRLAEVAGDHANDEWKGAASRWVESVAVGDSFMAEDVCISLAEAGYETRNRKAMGAVIRALQTRGTIAATGEYRPARLGHGRPMPVWRRV